MGLNGTGFAAVASRWASYVEGAVPMALTPSAGGAAVPFSLDQETHGFDETEAGAMATVRLGVMVRAQLTQSAVYTYDGHSWTCETSSKYAAGGVAWPYYATLVRHVE